MKLKKRQKQDSHTDGLENASLCSSSTFALAFRPFTKNTNVLQPVQESPSSQETRLSTPAPSWTKEVGSTHSQAPKTTTSSVDLTTRLSHKSTGRVCAKRQLSEVVIAVMGSTGAGKSSFIATVTGRKDVCVGHSLNSETSEVIPYRFTDGSKQYVLIDTPGFDDSRMSNDTITQRIVAWLESSYRQKRRLNGIVFIHNISKPRIQGSAYRNLRMLRQLCGDEALGNVVLATSFWDLVTPQVGAAREREIVESREFWADMVAKGSNVVRLELAQDSCLKILKQIAAKDSVELLVQRELVMEHKGFKDTAAGKDTMAAKIIAAEQMLAKERNAERRRFQNTLKERQEAYNRQMTEVQMKQKYESARAAEEKYLAEQRHERKIVNIGSQAKKERHVVMAPLRWAEAQERESAYRITKLAARLRSYRSRTYW